MVKIEQQFAIYFSTILTIEQDLSAEVSLSFTTPPITNSIDPFSFYSFSINAGSIGSVKICETQPPPNGSPGFE